MPIAPHNTFVLSLQHRNNTKTNIMLHTKEFYEIMEVFEKNAKKLVSMGNQGLTREDKEKWPKQNYYSDGNVNNAFKMFLHGVSLGKIL